MAKILIVDDEPDVLEILQKRLTGAGHKVSIACDGVEGLQKTLESLPDLILLDVMMPNKDGFSMLRELKENDQTSRIPVVMVTAKSELDSIYKAEGLAATDYILKPIVFEDLLRYVKRYTE